jgi:hypothetical protein
VTALSKDKLVANEQDDGRPGTVVRDPDFARRLEKACDAFPLVPAKNSGRQTWIKNQLAARFDISVSYETVSRWFAGEAKPRRDKMDALAEMLQVDLAWLSMGINHDLTPGERKMRNATADGAVNIVVGLIQMDGGHPAFPGEDDAVARSKGVHLHAIIKGAKYDFHVSTGEIEGDKVRFSVPASYDSLFVLGLIKRRFDIEIVELPTDMIATLGTRRGSAIDVVIDLVEARLRSITSFAQRI